MLTDNFKVIFSPEKILKKSEFKEIEIGKEE